MKQKKIIKSIEAYKAMQDEIFECIKEHGGRLHQDDFDKEFSGVKYTIDDKGDKVVIVNPPVIKITKYKRHTALLAPLGSILERYIHLLLLMQGAGLIDAETVDDKNFYGIAGGKQ